LVKKYSELIDRESAYELASKENRANRSWSSTKEQDQAKEKEVTKTTNTTTKQGPSTEVVGKSVLKVLTSATLLEVHWEYYQNDEKQINEKYSIQKPF
jgi:hypothetical protein